MSKTISALTFDAKQDGWEKSKGFIMRQVDAPTLDEKKNTQDAFCVVLKMKYAGVCGTDRGIWNRQAFRDLIHSSLEGERKTARIMGHEFLGEIVQAGSKVKDSFNLNVGDSVSGDSHITCGECYQCKLGENNVCTNELILGVSIDGVFASYVKLPAKNLWKVDVKKIRPEIASIMDPFGNAVHAVSKIKANNQTVAVFGVGPIGLFSVVLLKHFGAKTIIAIDINQENLNMAKELGADKAILVEKNTNVAEKVIGITRGIGADVAMEMAGPASSVVLALECVRRGGDVVLFGIKDGDFTIPKFSRVITKGLTLYGVIGRRIFETWQKSQEVLSDESNGVQEKIWHVILKEGKGTIVPFARYDNQAFKAAMDENPKIIFKF